MTGSRYPHVRDGNGDPPFIATCRCGDRWIEPQVSTHPPYRPAPTTWGANCPAAMGERIASLESAARAVLSLDCDETMEEADAVMGALAELVEGVTLEG